MNVDVAEHSEELVFCIQNGHTCGQSPEQYVFGTNSQMPHSPTTDTTRPRPQEDITRLPMRDVIWSGITSSISISACFSDFTMRALAMPIRPQPSQDMAFTMVGRLPNYRHQV